MSDDRDWLDELYAEGRDEAPPPALDAAILAAARETAGRPWYRNLRYLTTLATAASFVLAATVVYFGPDDTEVVGSYPRPAAATPAPEADIRVAEPAADAETATTGPRRSLEEAAPQSPAAPAAQDAPFAAGRAELVRQSEERLERTGSPPVRVMDSLDSGAETEADPAATLDGLAVQCGPPPGSEETRTLHPDALGWYLEVRAGDTQTYYRCADGAWQTIDAPDAGATASEQKPDPENDE